MNECRVKWCSEKEIITKGKINGFCKKHHKQMQKKGRVHKTRFDPNKFILKKRICKIIILDVWGNYRETAIIDREDYERIRDTKWYLSDGYVKGDGGKIRLHRVIMDAPADMEVDHQDCNPLNNRKSNLRICTHQENLRNYRRPANNTSGYKGVIKTRNKWQAQHKNNGENIRLGTFDTAVEAARAYNCATKKLYGKFARLNRTPVK